MRCFALLSFHTQNVSPSSRCPYLCLRARRGNIFYGSDGETFFRMFPRRCAGRVQNCLDGETFCECFPVGLVKSRRGNILKNVSPSGVSSLAWVTPTGKHSQGQNMFPRRTCALGGVWRVVWTRRGNILETRKCFPVGPIGWNVSPSVTGK